MEVTNIGQSPTGSTFAAREATCHYGYEVERNVWCFPALFYFMVFERRMILTRCSTTKGCWAAAFRSSGMDPVGIRGLSLSMTLMSPREG